MPRARIEAPADGWSRTATPSAPAEDPAATPARHGGDFDEFYAFHFQPLTVQLVAYCGDRQEAQDVVQEAFCRALARWHDVSRYDEPAAWVRRVAWNLATSRWRRVRTAMAYAARQRPRTVPGPEPDRVALIQALRRITPAQRRVVIQHYLGDMPVAEIAAQEGIAVGTVKSSLHRARAALAAHLDVEEERR